MPASRTLRTIAAGAAAAFVLSGCAISSQSGGDGERTTLTFWSYYTGTQADWLAAQVEQFEAEHPDVTIDIVQTVGDQQDQKLLASVATGSTPDLFINNIVVDYPTLVAGEVTADLTEYWDEYADAGQYPEAAAWRTDGQVYNLLPFTNLIGLYYNADVLAEVGIDGPPATLDELTEDLATVAADGRYKGLALSGAPSVEGAWLFAPQLIGLGVDYCDFEGPEVEAAFARAESWAKAGSTPQATATWDQTDAWQQFATGEFAFGINGNWNLGNAAEADFAWGTAQYPAPAGGESIVYPGGEGFAIGSASPHKDLAWEFLEQAVLSSGAGEAIFEAAGSIPVRADVSELPVIQENAEVQPFVAAAQTAAAWPNNENTASIQTALGKAISSVWSGQTSAADASATAVADIAAAIEDGGGTCS
ncbi:ABC transporter substrate-binding protein [Agromyces aerolatus]|uniref:ABC transporter substrate-binding protein n=1 Tax=Agromyces sp. LY-1074 TaxID=3074080 RepID=UPI002861A768|nr:MULTISPECIES: sugar ABC transporter substrate-binding protein [unclassified Agromyces]MDR5699737.1 sugar ABC transporter substrate-binding protein [Agromyces sp. LY-1074]MDR5706033.1 sugar ABC transporter substrate-binding protein [Agromyces sp. LY-1358]